MDDRRRALRVRSTDDVYEARRVTRELSGRAGFGTRGSQSAVIVASELCANIVKHGVEGELVVEIVTHGLDMALRLHARDRGPRIADLELALVDRSDARGPLDPAAFWGRGGIGSGLGAIARLSDELHYRHADDGNHFEVFILRAAADGRQPWKQRG